MHVSMQPQYVALTIPSTISPRGAWPSLATLLLRTAHWQLTANNADRAVAVLAAAGLPLLTTMRNLLLGSLHLVAVHAAASWLGNVPGGLPEGLAQVLPTLEHLWARHPARVITDLAPLVGCDARPADVAGCVGAPDAWVSGGGGLTDDGLTDDGLTDGLLGDALLHVAAPGAPLPQWCGAGTAPSPSTPAGSYLVMAARWLMRMTPAHHVLLCMDTREVNVHDAVNGVVNNNQELPPSWFSEHAVLQARAMYAAARRAEGVEALLALPASCWAPGVLRVEAGGVQGTVRAVAVLQDAASGIQGQLDGEQWCGWSDVYNMCNVVQHVVKHVVHVYQPTPTSPGGVRPVRCPREGTCFPPLQPPPRSPLCHSSPCSPLPIPCGALQPCPTTCTTSYSPPLPLPTRPTPLPRAPARRRWWLEWRSAATCHGC